MTLKLFEFQNEYFDTQLILANTWVEAIEIFKKNLYPKWFLEDPKYGAQYQEKLDTLKVKIVSTISDEECQGADWYMRELDLSCPGVLLRFSL